MQRGLSVIILIVLISNICAIEIIEVELNPAEDDSGNEWVEFYSKEEINLSDYKIVNNDGGEISLSGSFSRYYIYVFEKQWLDNSDERVFLYKGGELIDKTDLLEDSEDSDKTWQLCDDWEFLEETKDGKNNCEVEEETEESVQEIQEISEEVIEEFNKEFKENIQKEVINLSQKNPQVIKSEDTTENLNKNNYAIYGFVGFSILLGVLFIFRKKRNKKNEFK